MRKHPQHCTVFKMVPPKHWAGGKSCHGSDVIYQDKIFDKWYNFHGFCFMFHSAATHGTVSLREEEQERFTAMESDAIFDDL